MKKIYIFFVLIFFVSTQLLYSQTKISLQHSKDFSFELIQNKEEGFLAEQKVGNFEIVSKETERGIFSEIHTAHLMKVFTEGAPELPVVSKMIEIPLGAEVNVKVLSYDVEEIDLNQRGIQSQIIPAQPSESKSDDGKNRKFYFNEKIYSTDDYYGDELVKVEESGIMRYVRFGRLQISPMEYNPVKNKLRIFTNIKFEVEFSAIDYAKSNEFKRKYANSYFQGLEKVAINHIPASGKELIDDSPITYVIVSDPMFETQLQEFIEWKKLKGFHVIEAYTDDAAVGTTTTSIKDYLQDLYDNPAPGVNPPSFILFVGDIQQIPSFSSSEIATHYTDLRYCEYTGDNIPEVYYGRFSAQNTSQLQPQIDKTLLYEKYLMDDPSYLENAMLVAGVDASWAPTAGNGAINYSNGYYVNEEHGVNPLTYLYGDEANSTVMASSNSGASASILSYMNQGLGFANYTAHCSSSGWADPSFSTSNVNSLTNVGKYGIWIDNCCQSLMFGYDECFGEAGLRKVNGGAIGIIGGTESTYWYEDYWWGIGLKSGEMTANPTYEETGRGVYDAAYHDQANEVNDPTTWYIAQGQFNVVGNLAVEASTSTRKQYYWEIYHLMGDPSLVPYLRVPEAMIVSATPSTLMIGMSSLTVNAEPYAYVALSFNGELLDAQRADGTGQVTLNFDALSNVGDADLVVTCQNKQPHIGTITVSPSDQPYVVLQSYTIDDAAGNNNQAADYNETISLDVTLENVSDSYGAFNVHDSLYCNDPYITLVDSLELYGDIAALDSSTVTGAFMFIVSDSVPDQHVVSFSMHITGEDGSAEEYTWVSDFAITINAPALSIGGMAIDDSGSGNNDGILDPGETANLSVEVSNTGHADISGVEGLLSTASSDLTLDDSTDGPYAIATGEMTTLTFTVTANASTPIGTPASLTIDVSGGNDNYTATSTKQIVIGEIPEYLISDGGTVSTCYGLFYDSGGPTGEYSNDEDYTITFEPSSTGNVIKADFLSFAVEANYDELTVYDGSSSSATVIGSYDTGNPPGTIVASNAQGALTFVFTSDGSVTKSGWEAEITCVDVNEVKFLILDKSHPLEDVSVTFAGRTLYTDALGEATFIVESEKYSYTISKAGYETLEGTVDVTQPMTLVLTMTESYTVTFAVTDGAVALADAEVIFNAETKVTDTEGKAIFENVEPGESLVYLVSKDQYESKYGTIDVSSDLVKNIVLDQVTGINKLDEYGIKVYPVPASDYININNLTMPGSKKVEIIDVTGKVVYNNTLENVNNNINVSDFAKGIYFLRITIENDVIDAKISVQ